MTKKDTVTFSTNMNRETKELLERFCKARGIRINHLVEKAITEFIEDEMDRSIIEDRELEETIEWKKHG
jgi:hypothetical protein